jgi:hypothetical protein
VYFGSVGCLADSKVVRCLCAFSLRPSTIVTDYLSHARIVVVAHDGSLFRFAFLMEKVLLRVSSRAGIVGG